MFTRGWNGTMSIPVIRKAVHRCRALDEHSSSTRCSMSLEGMLGKLTPRALTSSRITFSASSKPTPGMTSAGQMAVGPSETTLAHMRNRPTFVFAILFIAILIRLLGPMPRDCSSVNDRELWEEVYRIQWNTRWSPDCTSETNSSIPLNYPGSASVCYVYSLRLALTRLALLG